MRTFIPALLAALLLGTGCDNSGTIPVDDDTSDDDTVGDDDVTDDDDDVTDDDDTGSDDDDTAPANCSGGSGIHPGYQFMEVDGASCWLYVPETVIDCAPLFLFGHGGNVAGGSLDDGMWNDQAHTDLPEAADQHGFVVLVPFVQDQAQTTHNWTLLDVFTMELMIDEVTVGVDIDLDHVLFAGTSAGGVMAAYWGLWEPDHLSQVGVLSSGYGYQVEYPMVEPDPKLPFFVGHDPDDQVAPYFLSEDFTEDLLARGHEVHFVDTDVGGNGHGWNPTVTDQILDWWLP